MLTNGQTPIRSQSLSEQVTEKMISKIFSEGICLTDLATPRIKRDYSTECRYVPDKSYCSSAEFVSRMVPKYFVTTVRVEGDEQAVTHYQRIDFARRTKAERYAETVNNFPREKTVTVYKSTLTYDPEYKQRHYVTRLDLFPVRESCLQIVTEQCNPPANCNGEQARLQSDDLQSQQMLLNGTA